MVISQKKAVKKKLMAATSMLLVACIMLISASYAWFTLSTAPEVTGLSTSVGSNGNLEIALANSTTWKEPSQITSNVGDSVAATQDVTKSNVTWGNIVSLSEKYGLEDVVLYPSQLNILSESGKVNASNPLRIAEYGADGRVAELVADGRNGYYDAAEDQLLIADDDYAGVRVLGASTGMSDREKSYRDAKADVKKQKEAAEASAIRSIKTYGSSLAGIVLEYGLNGESGVSFTKKDLEPIQGILNELDANAIPALYQGWKSAVIAMAAGTNGQSAIPTETEFKLFESKFKAVDASTITIDTDGTITIVTVENDTNTTEDETETVTFTCGTTYTTVLEAIKNLDSKVTAAITAVDTLYNDKTDTDSVTWNEINEVVAPVMDTNKVTIENYTKEQVKANKDKVLAAVLSKGSVEVQLPKNSGVFADIAEFTGDYSASITIDFDGTPIPATMVTQTTKAAYETTKTVTTPDADGGTTTTTTTETVAATQCEEYFDDLLALVGNKPEAESGTSVVAKVDDTYGYAIDLFVRTNAPESTLRLQVGAEQRVYGESTSEATMGGGSTMEFSYNGIVTEKLEGLMNAIRVVFTDASSNIVGVAVLDPRDGEEVADLKLCEYTIVNTAAEGATANYVLNVSTNADGSIKYASTSSDKETDCYDLLKLTQNEATKLSVYVFLDGEQVDNTMVSYLTSNTITGTLNLQFSSDVELEPMENTGLLEYNED